MQYEELTSSTPGSRISNSALVEYLDIFILVIILAFTLFNVPRALVYFMNKRFEAFQGCFLHSAARFRTYRSPFGTPVPSKDECGGPPEYYTPTLESAVAPQQWHFPMRISFRHPAAGFMLYHVLGSYNVTQVFLMAGYTLAVFYTALYESNLFSIPKRVGWVVASQIPFVYALAMKNNVIGLLVGIGYEKLNYLHRHVGRLVVIGANVHAIGYIYKWTLAGNISQKVARPYVCWGFLALTCFDFLGFFSIRYIRTRYYNFFFGTHVAGLVVALFAVCYHRSACIPFVVAAAAAYGLDHVVRATKTCFVTATLQTIPALGLTRVGIPSLNTGWRPGQHVRLRVLSTAMGLWGITEVHPFTIASATNTEEGLVLMCKRTGNWTNRLYEIARTVSGEQGQGPRRVRVVVEGPYGGIGDTIVPNYSGAMFVAGGSGVTFALSAVQDLVLASDKSRTKVIDVIWSITDPAALKHFIPLFTAIVSHSDSPASVRISVFYTRSATHSSGGVALPAGITLTAGRPNVDRLLDGFVASVKRRGGIHGAFVAVCGPVGLGKDVARAVRTCGFSSKKAIGGIQFHEEVFGW